ncbi:helix-turn-helix domain-containing protein [Nonomuraea sp. NPDC003709]|uniref:helix-turn-helix domain-containing protein n=1 Tax=Nonomuraea sp. NPDC003709 TaxID=3154450 RepID=UPI0033A7A3BC
MSFEALNWALNLAPVPVNSNGKPSASCAAVLVGLATHAGPDGTGAFPSTRKLVRYSRLCERTVRTALDRLEAEYIIRPCDPAIVAAHIKRGDRRPQGWDLAMERVRTDLKPQELKALEAMFPGVTARVNAAKAADEAPVDNSHTQPVDNRAGGVQRAHPEVSTGCNPHSDEVQPAQSRAATAAPEPFTEPNNESPPAAQAGFSASTRVDSRWTGGGLGSREQAPTASIHLFVAKLGPDWPLSHSQIRRLIPAVAEALAVGWDPDVLAEYVGANTAGIRNPYAVLVSRLADLPDPPRKSRRAYVDERTVAEAQTAVCIHGDSRPGACALCRRGIPADGIDPRSPALPSHRPPPAHLRRSATSSDPDASTAKHVAGAAPLPPETNA